MATDEQSNEIPCPIKCPTKHRSFICYAGLILFVLIVSIFTYVVMGTLKQVEQLKTQLVVDRNSVQALLDKSGQSLQDITRLSQEALDEKKNMEVLKEQIEHTRSQVIDLSNNTESLLAEANYLVSMANERLQTVQDISTALAHLIAADKKLSHIGTPAFLSVRKHLAEDIAKLQQTPPIQREEIWAKINQLQASFETLTFKGSKKELFSKQEDTKKVITEDSAWKKALRLSWHELKDLVRVRRVADHPLPEIISEQEAVQISLIMQSYCEQAKWAALRADPKLYQQSLDNLKLWLARYFLADKAAAQIQFQINDLAQNQITVLIPNISGSLDALSKALLHTQAKKRDNEKSEGAAE